jgi:hypothetical protein
MIYSKVAIDYSAGFRYVDYETDIEYQEPELKHLPNDVKGRILLVPKKIGCWVKEIEDFK